MKKRVYLDENSIKNIVSSVLMEVLDASGKKARFKVVFDVYGNFSKYLHSDSYYEDEYAYEEDLNPEAMKDMANSIKKLIDKGEIVITYNGNEVEVFPPQERNDFGNMFDDSWEIELPCEGVIPGFTREWGQFKSSMVRVKKCPSWLDPIQVVGPVTK